MMSVQNILCGFGIHDFPEIDATIREQKHFQANESRTTGPIAVSTWAIVGIQNCTRCFEMRHVVKNNDVAARTGLRWSPMDEDARKHIKNNYHSEPQQQPK